MRLSSEKKSTTGFAIFLLYKRYLPAKFTTKNHVINDHLHLYVCGLCCFFVVTRYRIEIKIDVAFLMIFILSVEFSIFQ